MLEIYLFVQGSHSQHHHFPAEHSLMDSWMWLLHTQPWRFSSWLHVDRYSVPSALWQQGGSSQDVCLLAMTPFRFFSFSNVLGFNVPPGGRLAVSLTLYIANSCCMPVTVLFCFKPHLNSVRYIILFLLLKRGLWFRGG